MFIVIIVCATTKKAKACKNCSCGLAEELEANSLKTAAPEPDTSTAKSSCGSVSKTLFSLTILKTIKSRVFNLNLMTTMMMIPIICSSATLAMLSVVLVVRTWACLPSNQAKKFNSQEICCKMIFNQYRHLSILFEHFFFSGLYLYFNST